jgi:hypothetical protein
MEKGMNFINFKGQYFCEAENFEGKTTVKIEIKMKSWWGNG